MGQTLSLVQHAGTAMVGPGDTVFMQARRSRFDVVVAQSHDQGLIPVKYLDLENGANVTLGLPFVRTSPDHATAFDSAERPIARRAGGRRAIASPSVLPADL